MMEIPNAPFFTTTPYHHHHQHTHTPLNRIHISISQVSPPLGWRDTSQLFIHENASENIVCEMAAILPRGRWVEYEQDI